MSSSGIPKVFIANWTYFRVYPSIIKFIVPGSGGIGASFSFTKFPHCSLIVFIQAGIENLKSQST